MFDDTKKELKELEGELLAEAFALSVNCFSMSSNPTTLKLAIVRPSLRRIIKGEGN